jgi:hypothetical protein
VHVRTGRAPGGADQAQHLALFHARPDLHVDAAEVQEVGADAVAVVQQHGAAGEVQVGFGERDDAGGGRVHRRAFRGRHVQAGVRRLRRAVVDALAAIHAADAAVHGPVAVGFVIVAVVVARARGGDHRLLALDARGDLRRRVHRRLRHALDALELPFPRPHRDFVLAHAPRRAHAQPQGALLVAADAERQAAIGAHANRRRLAVGADQFDPGARLDAGAHQRALHDLGGNGVHGRWGGVFTGLRLPGAGRSGQGQQRRAEGAGRGPAQCRWPWQEGSSGTGSYPPGFRGWQRPIRQAPIQLPLNTPKRSIACMV